MSLDRHTPTTRSLSTDSASSPSTRHDLMVCAYKDSPFLAECLASLSAQKNTSSRVVVCTSTPSDYIFRVAGDYGVPVLVSPRPSGIASDWNFALESATSEYVTVCHHDDIYMDDYSSRMVAAMDRSPNVLIGICGNTEHTSLGPRELQLNLRIKRFLLKRAFRSTVIQDTSRVRRRLLSLGNPVCCPGVIFNRSLIPDFRFSSDFKCNLDWDAWDRISTYLGKITYLSDPLVSHRVHEASQTSASIADNTRLREDYQMFRRYWPEPFCRLIMSFYRQSYSGNQA